MTDTEHADDLTLFANTPVRAESLLHRLEQAVEGGFYENINKTKFMCFKHMNFVLFVLFKTRRNHLNFRRPVSEISKPVHIPKQQYLIFWKWRLHTPSEKAWTFIDWLSVMWKFDHFDKIKWNFFLDLAVSILLYGCTLWTLMKHLEKKWDGNYPRILSTVLNKSWNQEPQKTAVELIALLPNHPSKTNRTCSDFRRSKDELICHVLSRDYII